LAQLPKRYGVLKATPEEEVIGWGIHFQEGVHWNTVIFLGAVFVIFGIIFALVWAVKRGDMQGGFAVTGCVLALCSLLVAFLMTR
jgi:hypothetical protein